MKLVLGPKFKDNHHLKEKLSEYRQGLLDEYECLLYIPADSKNSKQFSNLKVRDIRKYMFEVYIEELF